MVVGAAGGADVVDGWLELGGLGSGAARSRPRIVALGRSVVSRVARPIANALATVITAVAVRAIARRVGIASPCPSASGIGLVRLGPGGGF